MEVGGVLERRVSKGEVVKTPSQQKQAISLGKIILTKRQTSLMEKRKSSTIYVYLFFFHFSLESVRGSESKKEREREKSHKSVQYLKKKVRSDSLYINMCSRERCFKLLGGSVEEGFLIKIT